MRTPPLIGGPGCVALCCVIALACGRSGLDAPSPNARGSSVDPSPGADAAAGGTAGIVAGVLGCIAQATAVYDTTPVIRRTDGSIWVAADRARFTEIVGPSGRFHATDLAVSGSTTYGRAIGCVIESGAVWCFPLVQPFSAPIDLGAGLGQSTQTTGAERVVTSAGLGAAPLGNARQLSGTMNSGGATFCAVTEDGGVWCWGDAANGLLGRDDATDYSSFARPVLDGPAGKPLTNVAEVRVGFDSACARKRDGTVWCWGAAALGQRGIAGSSGLPPGTAPPNPYPSGPVPLKAPAMRLAANPGQTHCAIVTGGRVWCWGWNSYGQAGEGATPTTSSTDSPAPVVLTPENRVPLAGVVDLAPDRGMQAMCARTDMGKLLCWGHTFPPPGAIDQSTTTPIEIPVGRGAPRLLTIPLSSYGGSDGTLVYVDPDGKLTLGAGAFPLAAQPPCD